MSKYVTIRAFFLSRTFAGTCLSLRRLAGGTLLALALSVTGCASMHGNTEDGGGSFAPDWSNALRMPPANSELLGTSENARQIERNLGFE